MTLASTGRAQADAEECGLTIAVRERPEAHSLAEAATYLELEADGIVKSLVIRRNADDYIFALLPANRSLSWPLLRAAVGINRMSLPDADEARSATGYERGTISPIGSTTSWPVFIDAATPARISIGSGSHEHCLIVDRDEFAAAYGAKIVALSK